MERPRQPTVFLQSRSVSPGAYFDDSPRLPPPTTCSLFHESSDFNSSGASPPCSFTTVMRNRAFFVFAFICHPRSYGPTHFRAHVEEHSDQRPPSLRWAPCLHLFPSCHPFYSLRPHTIFTLIESGFSPYCHFLSSFLKPVSGKDSYYAVKKFSSFFFFLGTTTRNHLSSFLSLFFFICFFFYLRFPPLFIRFPS